MNAEALYKKFIEDYSDYPKKLSELIARQVSSFVKTEESPQYNLGTMQKDADIGLSQNIVVINAYEFRESFEKIKKQNPQLSDTEARSRVVFDFLQKHGASFSYEQNKDDILFGNVTREQFYAQEIFNQALSNTNFFDRHIGNMQLICMEPKPNNALPRNIDGASQEIIEQFLAIPNDERAEILYKRGLYHEGLHTAMGTFDERKCDTFALLKIMQEHPRYAKAVFDIYNIQRSKIGYTVNRLLGKDINSPTYKREIKGGAMTSLMPNTYQKLEEFALNPEKIPTDDSALLELTCRLTSDTEFSQKQLDEFNKVLRHEHISKLDFSQCEIVQSCMKQGGFDNVSDYIESDKKLKNIFDTNIPEKLMSLRHKIAHLREPLSIHEIRSLAPKGHTSFTSSELRYCPTLSRDDR